MSWTSHAQAHARVWSAATREDFALPSRTRQSRILVASPTVMRTSFLSSTGALANCFASGQRELRCEGVGADSIQRSAAARLVRIARCAVAEAEVHAVEWLIGKECPPPRLYGSSQVGGGRKQRAYKAAERVCAELSATALATGRVATVPRVGRLVALIGREVPRSLSLRSFLGR